jgi:pimeloyl-ACP methyl ester carboxylesterase
MKQPTGWIPVDGGELPSIEAGAGPCVLLLHAGIADMSMWEPQVDELSTDFVVAAYDARGYGLSRSEPGTYSPLADLVEVAQARDEPSVALVGCSLGGALALEYAAANPDRVWALVWVCGGIWGSPRIQDEVEAAYDARREALKASADWEALADADAAFWVDGPRTPGRGPAELRSQVRDMILHNIHRPDDGLVLDFDPPSEVSRLRAITCPVLLVLGDFDATAIAGGAATLKELLPNVEETHFPTAHLPNLEFPSAFADVVRDFLQRAWSSTGSSRQLPSRRP